MNYSLFTTLHDILTLDYSYVCMFECQTAARIAHIFKLKVEFRMFFCNKFKFQYN